MTVDDKGHDDEVIVRAGQIITPNPLHDGVLDVISMKALVRAVSALRRQHPTPQTEGDFERALVKMINLNGAMARLVQDGRR